MDTAEHDNTNLDNSQKANADETLVRTSVPGVAACVLAVASLLLLPGMMWAFEKDVSESVRNLYFSAQFGTWLLAGALGIVGLIDIGTSGGRRVGKGFAWVGVAAPIAEVLLVLFLASQRGGTAYRMVCGINLSRIGKAMLIYANDYEDELPRAGGPSSQWTGRVADWTAPTRQQTFALSADGSGGHVSVSASLYLLVKYAEVTPKSFLCGAGSRKTREKGVSEFKRGMYRVANPKAELIDFWDFGPDPTKHCNYAYHMVYGPSKLTIAAPAGFAVAADRNPWMDSPSTKAGDFWEYLPDIAPYNGTSDQARRGNSPRHEGEGQNVLFLDGHVDFEKRSFCGLNNDNIYTSWNGERARGTPPKLGSVPADPNDSLLVNDPVQPSK
jgi:prepilin-type processing-associated H-X9-DG protein